MKPPFEESVTFHGFLEGKTYATSNVVVPLSGDKFTIAYRLKLDGSEWKVYDVIIENVGM